MFLAIDIGGTTIKSGLVDSEGKIVAYHVVPTQGESNSAFAGSLRQAILPLLKKNLPDACGIGSPGPLDLENGEIIASANMAGLKHFPIVSQVRQIFSELGYCAPVFLNNDANCAALGQLYFGLGKESQDFAVLTLGTGLGGGLILNKKLFGGYQGNGFEVGHVPVAWPFFREEFADIPLMRCGCGSLGCVETFASARGVQNYYAYFTGSPNKRTAKEIAEIAEQDPNARKTFRLAAFALAGLLQGLIHTLNLPLIIITGGMAAAEKWLRPSLEEKLLPSLFPIFRERTKIVFTQGDEHSGVLGAAALCITDSQGA